MLRRAHHEGRIRLHRNFPSSYLSTRRDLIVYLPPGYEQWNRRYPVLYLQDGQNLFDPATAFGGKDWRVDVAADEAIGGGAVAPVIIVGIYHTGVRRISEYTPTRDRRSRKGGKAARYAQTLAREIKPFIDHEYRTLKPARHSAIGGSSLGALASLITILEYPRVFGAAALLSPSVWWDGRSILEAVRKFRSVLHPRIWLDTGTLEGNNPAKVVDDARALCETLRAAGWQPGRDLEYREFEGAPHSEDAWAARFGDVLRYLFPPAGIE